MHDDENILDPVRLRRLGNTMVLFAGGIGVLTQLARGSYEAATRIRNSRVISAIRKPTA